MANGDKTHYELPKDIVNDVLPVVVSILADCIGSKQALSNWRIRNHLSGMGITISDTMFRDVIHAIRVTGTIRNLLSNSRGYYIAQTYHDVKAYTGSLKKRIRSQQLVVNALNIQATDFPRLEHDFIDEEDETFERTETINDW